MTQHSSDQATQARPAGKKPLFRGFRPEATDLLNKAALTKFKGGKRSGLTRQFSTVFSWNTSCGGPVPQ